jgi:hypothetical protein
MNFPRRFAIVAVCACLVVPSAASAGKRLWGFGPTRAAAIADANYNGYRRARGRNTCFHAASRYPVPLVDGRYRAMVMVANHGGSCPPGRWAGYRSHDIEAWMY